MEKITLNKIGVGLFKSSQAAPKTASNHSNPFGVSFKGNVISADVFETSKNETAGNGILEKGKMLQSAIVGNINSFNNAIKSRVNSAVSFGRQVRDNISSAWEQAKNTEITFDLNALSSYVAQRFAINPYGVNNLQQKPVSELEEMLKAQLA